MFLHTWKSIEVADIYRLNCFFRDCRLSLHRIPICSQFADSLLITIFKLGDLANS